MTEEELLEETEEEEKAEDAGEADAAVPAVDDFEEEEDYRLTLKQKVMVGVALALSTVIFSVLFFPRDVMLRGILSRAAPQVKVDFSQASPGLFEQGFQSLRVALPDGTSFASEELQSKLSLISLIGGSASGTVDLLNADYGSSGMNVRGKNAAIKLNLSGISEGVTGMRGDLLIQATDVSFDRLPAAMAQYIQIEPSRIKVRTVQIPVIFEESGLSVPDGRLASNLFNIKVRIAGTYRGQVLDTMQIDGSVCLKPDEKLEADFPDIFGIYVFAGGTGGGDLCFDVKGTVAQPQFAKK